MQYYTFRYDYPSIEVLEELKKFIKQNCTKYVLFDEIAEETKKKHVQGKIYPVRSIETFRRNLLEKFNLKNKDKVFDRYNYSIAEIKKEGYDKYICKGKVVWINNAFTEEEIDKNYSDYWELNKEIKNKTKTGKEKPLTWSQELTKSIKEKYPNREWKYDTQSIDILSEEVCNALGSQSKKLGLHIYKEMIQGQLNALSSRSGIREKLYMEAFPDLYGSKY